MERHIDDLPLLPQVLVRLMQLDPASDDYFEQFELLAKEDPAFAVRILALANSAASAPVDPVQTIRDALTRMGAVTIAGLVASLSVQRVFMPTEPAQVRLWRHAIEVAVAAQKIARLFPELDIEPSHAYLIGLLHDIGRFVMLEHAAPELRRVDETHWESPEELVQADMAVYEYTHSELGYLACRHWGLPDSIATTIRAHHEPIDGAIAPGTDLAVLSCVQIADRIGVFLLGANDARTVPDADAEQKIVDDCYYTDDQRSTFPAAALCGLLSAIRAESAELFSGLGFS